MTTAIVIDNGLYVELALHLAHCGWDVFYYTPWQRANPLARDMAIGAGFDDAGVTRLNNPLTAIDGTDFIWIFPDLYHNDLQEYVRKLGRKVWGCGTADLLERDRRFFYDTLATTNLPVAPYVIAKGVEELRAHLEKTKDKYIKISTYRGEMETEHHEDWEKSRVWYDPLVARLGPIGQAMQFIIQDPVESDLEIGADWIFLEDGWTTDGMLGAESKNKAYVGKVMAGLDLPKEIFDPMGAIETPMLEAGYRNFFSIELRKSKKGPWYATDATCRLPSPPFESQLCNITNLPAVIKDSEQPEYAANWVAQLILRSPWSIHHPVRVDTPEEYREFLKLYRVLRADGALWVMPDDASIVPASEIGSVVGLGDTPEEATKFCREVAKEVDAYQLEYDDKALDDALKTMEEMEKLL